MAFYEIGKGKKDNRNKGRKEEVYNENEEKEEEEKTEIKDDNPLKVTPQRWKSPSQSSQAFRAENIKMRTRKEKTLKRVGGRSKEWGLRTADDESMSI
jgi:hypothetical protein